MRHVLSSAVLAHNHRESSIVQNEAGALTVCLAYLDAQIEYAREDRTGEGLLQFAQRLFSSPGQRDGLFWTGDTGELEGVNGIVPVRSTAARGGTRDQPEPLFGYHYRILTSQGVNAAGGKRDFLLDGHLTGGFGLIAWPVEYGASGINTFIIDHLGQVFEKDLGIRSEEAAETILEFDPDKTWTKVE
jgi:hypothetical protein